DMTSERIQCSNHGPAFATFVCKHVVEGEGLGFVYDPESDEPWPDATCSACAEEPPWSDETAKERIRLLCSRCWEAAFERNASAGAVDEHAWFRRACERSKPKQAQWRREFRIDSFSKYHYCFDPGEAWLAFGDSDGFRIRCDAHVVGSWSPTAGTWLWGWANHHWERPDTPQPVRGQRRG